MDSFGTACNVTGDGAIALVVDKITEEKWFVLKSSFGIKWIANPRASKADSYLSMYRLGVLSIPGKQIAAEQLKPSKRTSEKTLP
jgi:hypothetical protein